ncbi:hypothetical protein BGZ88_000889 [Linnemannia elongata]|nr:hypothetical protein BGZ88_000889 [Linnemannia elongata]
MATQSENTNGTPAEPTSGSNATVAVTNGDANGATAVANGIEATEKEAVPLKQLYEQSTQYNHWRYAQQELDDMRNKVNQEVVSSIKQNFQDESDLRTAQGLSLDDLPQDFKYLTVEDELTLLGFYERRIVKIFQYWKLPSYVMATAVVYMKRFFLENTVMDHHPKDVMLTCMFLARKTENYLMSIEDFSKVLKSPAESILQLEFLVCKTLRFHFTVHHPYRPCLGFFFDMQAVTENMSKLQKVYERALTLIDTALHTDLCFLYQPSQIALATMRIASKDEAYDFERYAKYKFMSNESATQKYNSQLLPILEAIEKVLKEDRRCVEVDKLVATEIDKRLKLCKDPARNPESLLYMKRKRGEAAGDDDDDDDDTSNPNPDKRVKLGDSA